MFGLHVDYGLPLPVRAWCDESGGPCSGPDDSLYAGSRSGGPRAAYPFVAIGTTASTAILAGHEYSLLHEFGHAMITDVNGNELPALPRNDHHHGGYFQNTTSTDAWNEGFATFFAWLVQHAPKGDHARSDLAEFAGWKVPLESDVQTKAWDN